MKKLCVIIGAGASFDAAGVRTSSSTTVYPDWKPPLTNQIFENRATFNGLLSQHRRIDPLVHILRDKLSKSPNSLETELSTMYKSDSITRKTQIKYLAYYFWCLFNSISRSYIQGGPSNFDRLVDEILERNIEVVFLTLNYDVFLEKAFEKIGFTFESDKSYINAENNWKLIKLHGSASWGRRLLTQPSDLTKGINNLKEIANLDTNSGLAQDIEILPYASETYPIYKDVLYFPIISIPTAEKDDFVCPDSHRDCAIEFLKSCGNFLILGCALRDKDILDLLSNVVDAQRLRVVNGNRKGSFPSDVVSTLKKINAFNKTWDSPDFDGTFDGFIYDGSLEKYLSNIN